MAKFNAGYNNIKVKLISWEGDNFAKRVYEFGRLSHDYIDALPEVYDKNNPDCIKLIDKIIEGTTLPKFALQGTGIEFRIEDISRICLAQLTRDEAIFASASTGVFPLSQIMNIPLSVYCQKDIMQLVEQAQDLLEEAYICCCEREIPTIESRYIGLHCQVISLTASYKFSNFVRSCYSRTSSNFCDECNYVYRLMYKELVNAIEQLTDEQSIKLYKWIFAEDKCVNDKIYKRERLYNSDFTYDKNYIPAKDALNDWRRSGWKMELERMYFDNTCYLTEKERKTIQSWLQDDCFGLPLRSSYNNNALDVAVNAIKNTDYYKKHRGKND